MEKYRNICLKKEFFVIYNGLKNRISGQIPMTHQIFLEILISNYLKAHPQHNDLLQIGEEVKEENKKTLLGQLLKISR